jgi:hypothetical protein
MNNTKRTIIEQGINFIEVCDKPSKNNTPTPESVQITIAFNEAGKCGFAVKLPKDQPVPRVGKSIAVRNFMTVDFSLDQDASVSDAIFAFFKVKSNSKKTFTPEIRDRIRSMFSETLIATRQS